LIFILSIKIVNFELENTVYSLIDAITCFGLRRFHPGINLSEAQRGPWFILPLVFGRNVVSTLNFVQNRQGKERLNFVQIG